MSEVIYTMTEQRAFEYAKNELAEVAKPSKVEECEFIDVTMNPHSKDLDFVYRVLTYCTYDQEHYYHNFYVKLNPELETISYEYENF
jgi:hypothetical protein